jgi:hypothetical protein
LENKDVLVLMQTGGGLNQQSAIHNLKANPWRISCLQLWARGFRL